MIEPNHLELPPWKSPETWSQAIRSIEYTVEQQSAKLYEARRVVRQIAESLSIINTSIDSLCRTTCVDCTEICCKNATVWYDFKDLLFIYLNSGTFPQEQISRKPDLSCCNLTPSGCRLGRTERPFICTWYICPSQTAILPDKYHSGSAGLLSPSLNEIKAARNHLEERFITAVYD